MTSNLSSKSMLTRAVHAGERPPHPDYTPVSTPIYPSVGYMYDSMDDLDAIFATTREGYVYPRYGSPTVSAFETAVAELETAGGAPVTAYALAAGMAAIHVALLAMGVKAGASVVAAMDIYGATYSIFQKLFGSLGVNACFVDVSDLAEVETALSDSRPVALLAETISNPLLKVADVPSVANLAHRYGAQLLIDNTFATPHLFTPLSHGADYVVHSATKYIGGHGDVMAGVVVTGTENRPKLYELNKMVGSVLGPFEAWLALRGIKTFPLRVRQQFANAEGIAEWLTGHPQVARVNYPGLPEHPQNTLASRLFEQRGFGGMLSFEISGASRSTVFRFMEALDLCLPATTLGDIYSLVLHPATSSHRSLTEEQRARVGIRESLVRFSAGIEDSRDIISDLDQALSKSGRAAA
jgi:cystathionine beta-lyase/cystathionine gamma-synthase